MAASTQSPVLAPPTHRADLLPRRVPRPPLGLELATPDGDRGKRRLYLLCQSACWVALPGLLILVGLGFSEPENAGVATKALLSTAAMLGLGFVLTHFVRVLIRRWGWKQLDWRPLFPRLLAMAAVLSGLWAAGYHALAAIAGIEPWSAEISPAAILVIRWIQGLVIFTGWLFVYFFYHLSDRLTRSEFERLRLAAGAKEAELRALKSQVNPHFIFNSLNSLRALIEEDPARARSAVTRLAGLLRYALQSGQHETVPLEDELRIVHDYLALEQVRFEDRLRVRLDAAPDTLALPVPPLLLQTLVENAVKYGIAPRPEGGEIAIRTRRDGTVLRLEVANPGSLAPAVPGEDGSTGLGIRNAAERLRLLFGDGASLQLRPAPDAGVLAEVVIPLPDPR
jgi:signal transduction histidine kinase